MTFSNNFLNNYLHFYNIILIKYWNWESPPDSFHVNLLIPIYKSGNVGDILSHRPISLSNCIKKLFEKLIKLEVTRHLLKYNNQYCYKQSCEEAVDAIHKTIRKKYYCKNCKTRCYLLFGDLAKAFDKLNRTKLEEYSSDHL
eukprot:NODE_77_length_23806_cov_0.393892.p13 type:complete len:142 gc:universal NODE_77_length_23806_cov_0.393892:12657-12232(-)